MKSSTTFWIRKSVRDTRYHVRDSADPNPPHPMTTTSNWLYGPWEQLILKSEYDKVLVELQKVRDENERMMATDYWFDRYKIAEARIKELEGSQK